MYTAAIHVHQVLGISQLSISLSETTDDGFTYHLASSTSSSDLLSSAGEDPLWIFVQQIKEAVSIALDGPTNVYRRSIEHDRVDGGWGGAGQPDSRERSE